MLIAYCFNEKDADLALKNASWLASLKHERKHKFFLGYSGCDPKPIKQALEKSFEVVAVQEINDPYNKWPESVNRKFVTCAREISARFKERWLWLEPDSTLVKDSGFDVLEEAAQKSKKPFFGGFVPKYQDSPDHMTGIAIYPPDLIPYAGEILISEDLPVPFDLIAAEKVVKYAMFTDLIQHLWSPPFRPSPPFKTLEDVKARMTSECVLYHADKTGTLIDVLKMREPKEGEKNNGMIFSGGAWHKDVDAEEKQKSGEDNHHNESPAPSASPLTLQDHVKALREYADQSWNAKGRVIKQLKAVGLTARPVPGVRSKPCAFKREQKEDLSYGNTVATKEK